MATKLQLPPLSFQPLTSSSHLPLPDSPPQSRPSSTNGSQATLEPGRPHPLNTKQSNASLKSPTSPRPGSIRRFLSKMSMNSSYRDSDTASIMSKKEAKSPPTTASSVYAESIVSAVGRSPSRKSSASVLRRNTVKRGPSQDFGDVKTIEDLTKEAMIKDPAPKLPDVPSTDLSFDNDMFASIK